MTHSIDIVADFFPDSIKRFSRLFNRFNNDLTGAFERANEEYDKHMPSKGNVCEAALCKYLLESLGSRYAVATNGHIFDSEGNQSKETDIIIFDDHWSGRLTPKDSGEPPLIPVESVYTTIQVKKTLSATDLRDALDNIRSFKSLKRERIGLDYITPNRRITNLGASSKHGERNPFYSIVFAFSAKRSIDAVFKQLKEEAERIPFKELPDLVVVHNQGVILPFCRDCNTSASHISTILVDGHSPTYLLDRLDGKYSLLGFHFLLLHHLHYTILIPPNLDKMYSILANFARQLEAIKDEG